MWQILFNEFAGDGKDQAGLNQRVVRVGCTGWIVGVEWKEKIRKRKAGLGVRHRRDRRLNPIARKINPFQKVSDLVSPNTLRDFQHFQAAGFPAKRRIETRPTLFDVSEVKRSDVSNHLDMIWIVEVGIGDGDGGAVGYGNGLWKRRSKVRVCRAAVVDVPAGVDVEVHEVGEAADASRSRRRAPWEITELVEID